MYCYQFASDIHKQLQTQKVKNFPDGPLVETLPSSAEGASLISTGGAKIHMPWGQKTKTQNRSKSITNSIKSLKMVHMKKKS